MESLYAKWTIPSATNPFLMCEIQSENFGKDNNVLMEIQIVTNKGRFNGPNATLTQHVISYAHLLDDKPQIAVTTFINTEQSLKTFIEDRN